ncbi:hypothetical protein ES705_24080 [subsurface metagenome]
MSFAIPGIAIADVPLYALKHYILNWSKLTGWVINTWYTVLEDVNIEDLLYMKVWQDNDEEENKDLTFKITIDDEVYQGDDLTTMWETMYYLYLTQGAIGVNPTITTTTERVVFGARDFEHGAGALSFTEKRYGGHVVKVEIWMDVAPGTNQEVYMDIAYQKKEAS